MAVNDGEETFFPADESRRLTGGDEGFDILCENQEVHRQLITPTT